MYAGLDKLLWVLLQLLFVLILNLLYHAVEVIVDLLLVVRRRLGLVLFRLFLNDGGLFCCTARG